LKAQSPQNALVLGHSLKQIALLKYSLGIVEGSMNAQTEAQTSKHYMGRTETVGFPVLPNAGKS